MSDGASCSLGWSTWVLPDEVFPPVLTEPFCWAQWNLSVQVSKCIETTKYVPGLLLIKEKCSGRKKKNFHRRGEKCYSFNIYEFGSLGLVCCFSLFPAATNNYSLVNSTIAYVKNINCELEVVFMFFSLFFNPFQNAYFSFQKDFFFPFIRCAERVAHNCAQNFKII